MTVFNHHVLQGGRRLHAVRIQRYRRLARRRGKLKALVAVARSVLVIAWHLLSDRDARFHDLGAGYYTSRIDKNRKTRSHVRQLEALGYTVALTPAA